jgi:hypothetical protein
MTNAASRIGLAVAVLGLLAGVTGRASADLSVEYTGLVTGGDPWFVPLNGFETSLYNDPVLTDVRVNFDFDAGTYLQVNNLVSSQQETTITIAWTYTIAGLGSVLASGTSAPRSYDITVGGSSQYQSSLLNAAEVSSPPLFGIDLGPDNKFINNPVASISTFLDDDIVGGSATVIYSYTLAPEPSTLAMLASAVPLGIGWWHRRRKHAA